MQTNLMGPAVLGDDQFLQNSSAFVDAAKDTWDAKAKTVKVDPERCSSSRRMSGSRQARPSSRRPTLRVVLCWFRPRASSCSEVAVGP